MVNPQQEINKLLAMQGEINNQIARWREMPQIPTIQQNFITANAINDFDARWVDNIEDVKNTPVTKDTLFMERNDAIFHIKTSNGEIKSFSFQEFIYLDEKDKKIQKLEEELNKLKNRLDEGGDTDGKSIISDVRSKSDRQITVTDNINEPIKNEEPNDV